uniref:Tail tube protein n=1 Tax=Pantoea phage Survivor TaxID=3232176 RepID=A0AAU8L0H8_9CAUD
MQHVSLIPVLNATTEQYFVERVKIEPFVVEFGVKDKFDRGPHYSSHLKAGIEIPFGLLCKLNCNEWTVNDQIDMTTLALKGLTFEAVNKVTGQTEILNIGTLFGVATARALPPTFSSEVDNRIVNFAMRHFSTKLFRNTFTGQKTSIFGDEEGQTVHFNFKADINQETLTSSAEVTKCSNPDVELTIIGFDLYAEHRSTSLADC